MDAWRSTFPRRTVWEDALAEGFVEIESGPGCQAEVILSSRGRTAMRVRTAAVFGLWGLLNILDILRLVAANTRVYSSIVTGLADTAETVCGLRLTIESVVFIGCRAWL